MPTTIAGKSIGHDRADALERFRLDRPGLEFVTPVECTLDESEEATDE